MIPKYKPKWFPLKELVSEALYTQYDHDRLWNVFDWRILVMADQIRIRYGKTVCNTWPWNGPSQYRGFRPTMCEVGSQFSQHRFGRALDLVPIEVTTEEVRRDIAYRRSDFKYITAMELGTDWLHIDCRSHDVQTHGIFTFSP